MIRKRFIIGLVIVLVLMCALTAWACFMGVYYLLPIAIGVSILTLLEFTAIKCLPMEPCQQEPHNCSTYNCKPSCAKDE